MLADFAKMILTYYSMHVNLSLWVSVIKIKNLWRLGKIY